MAEATVAQPTPDLTRALNMGEKKTVARAPQASPIKPTQSLNLPATSSDPAGRLNSGKQAARTASQPPATRSADGGTNRRINSKKQAAQQAKQEAQRAKQEKIKKKGGFTKRDQGNQHIDRSVLLMMADFSFGMITGLVWFNLKLIWGSIIKKGESRFISPPSFKAWRIPILPDSLANATIVLADILVLLFILAFVLLIFIVIGFIAMAAEGSVEAIQFLDENFGFSIF